MPELFIALLAYAGPTPGYYQAAEGQIGAELRAALHAIISGHRAIAYSSGVTNTATALMVLDEDPTNTNNVILLYARRSEPKTTFGLASGWNREHLWPNSYGLEGNGPDFTDLHNLRAEDATVNSARGNKLFDRTNPNEDPGDPAHPEAPLCSTDRNSWEPPDEVQGDIARALFYMAIRYQGTANNEARLTLTDDLATISSITNRMGRLSTLLRWHLEDPVDDRERRRNDLIFELYQRNRNPFVDRPEWVPAAFHPALLISRKGDVLLLRWPVEFTEAVLEMSSPPLLFWQPSGVNVSVTNGFRQVVLPLDMPASLFRLSLL